MGWTYQDINSVWVLLSLAINSEWDRQESIVKGTKTDQSRHLPIRFPEIVEESLLKRIWPAVQEGVRAWCQGLENELRHDCQEIQRYNQKGLQRPDEKRVQAERSQWYWSLYSAKLFDQDDFIVEDLVLAEDDCLIA